MKVERAFEVLKMIVSDYERAFKILKAIVGDDYDRMPNEGDEAIKVVEEEIFNLRKNKAFLES